MYYKVPKATFVSDVLRDSMVQPLTTVGRRFQSMKVNENPVRLGVPANEAQITEQFQHALFVDPSLSPSDLTAKSLKIAEAYQKFIKSHCHSSQYIYFRSKIVLMQLAFIAWSILYAFHLKSLNL